MWPGLLADVPAVTAELRRLNKELHHRGFKFVGPTTLDQTRWSHYDVHAHVVDWNGSRSPDAMPQSALTARRVVLVDQGFRVELGW